jgi:hypothetical protein
MVNPRMPEAWRELNEDGTYGIADDFVVAVLEHPEPNHCRCRNTSQILADGNRGTWDVRLDIARKAIYSRR